MNLGVDESAAALDSELSYCCCLDYIFFHGAGGGKWRICKLFSPKNSSVQAIFFNLRGSYFVLSVNKVLSVAFYLPKCVFGARINACSFSSRI